MLNMALAEGGTHLLEYMIEHKLEMATDLMKCISHMKITLQPTAEDGTHLRGHPQHRMHIDHKNMI